MEDSAVIKLPILHRSTPYVYVKMDLSSKSYRLSANYKYLNEQYNLKINFIRDFNKIDCVNNKYFSVDTTDDISVLLKNSTEWQTWNMGDSVKGLLISRLIVTEGSDTNTIIVLKRFYDDDINYSLFFASTKYYTIDQFLGDTK